MRRDSIVTALGALTAAAAVFALSTQSCGIIDTSGTGGVNLGPPSIQITSPSSNTCVAAQAGEIPYVPISLDVQNLQLEPPGVCSQALTTVSSTVTGGLGGSGGANTVSLPCGHLQIAVCSKAAVVKETDESDPTHFWKDDNEQHCPLGAPPNNQGSGTEIDLLLPDIRDPTPDQPCDEIHVDLILVREARFIGELFALEPKVKGAPQGLDLSVVKPGGVCTTSCGAINGSGGASGLGGASGMGGASGGGT